MMQKSIPRAKLEDVANVTGRSFFPVSKPIFNIGRSPKNDLVIKQNTVSAKHAAIEKKPDGYFVVDLNSSNKTQLNGVKLDPNSPRRLNDGDEISFYTFSFMFKLEEIELPPPAPDHEETVFLDSSSLMDEVKKAKPPPPAPNHEETVFLDSSSLMDEVKKGAFVQPGHVHREDTGGKPSLEEESTVRMEPEATTETKKIGNYEIIKLLGEGGFGSVWQAKASDGQPVAIKVLNPDILENDRAVRKFFHEAINLSKMNHPNICRFIDFFPDEGNYAIVMEAVQGIDLKALLKKKQGPLPLEKARLIAAQTLDAFHYAHLQQVLHRDIKPENITLNTEGAVKVMDFGIAKLSSSESQQTSLYMISPAYTAPERFDPKLTDSVDHRSYIYSLGLVFYEMFTGTHPFPIDNPMEMIVAHLKTVPTPPNQVADLPQEISDGILKALEKDPEDRFEDFAAFKMEMLGEAPLRASQSMGPLEFSGEYREAGAVLLKTLSGIVKKHEKQARKITVGQVGRQVQLIIETVSGNSIYITRDIEKKGN